MVHPVGGASCKTHYTTPPAEEGGALMSEVVLIYGKSGAGKTRSLKNFAEDEIFYVNITNKRLPFAHGFNFMSTTDDVDTILEAVKRMPCNIAVIDDAGYIMTNLFMEGHGKGDGFKLFNDIADKMWKLILGLKTMPNSDNKIVYLTFHEEKGDQGDSKLLTIGKLLDQKCNIEGLCTIVLHAMVKAGKHIFVTNSDGYDIAKSPEGMFEMEIENDLQAVDARIREFYHIGGADPAPETKKEAKK